MVLERIERFSYPESHSKISNIRITELFYSSILNGTEISFIQAVSVVYTCPCLADVDELKIALQVQKVSRTNEKQAPALACNILHKTYLE